MSGSTKLMADQGTKEVVGEKRCEQMLAAGQRCQGRRLKGSEFCFWHADPEAARERVQQGHVERTQREARSAELLAGSERQYLSGSELRALLARTLARLEQGLVSPGVAYAMGYLVQVLEQLGAPPEPPRRLTAKEQEERRIRIQRQIREIYGWSDEELDAQYGPRKG